MNEKRSTDDRLVAALLRRIEALQQKIAEHLDAETLAMYAEGQLSDDDRLQADKHLAVCDECRETVSLVMAVEAETTITTASRPWWQAASHAWPVYALAASLFIAVGLWYLTTGPTSEAQFYAQASQRLQTGDFAAVKQLTDAAKQQGLASARLLNLRAQAARQIPDLVAMHHAGRLTDFGVELGGIVARDTKPTPGLVEAEQTLQAALADKPDREALLNRGHLQLTRNQFVEARQTFEQVMTTNPNDNDALLGVGLVQYLAAEYTAAESTFAQVEKLDPQNLTARWNRAMTLEELDRTAEAMQAWNSILSQLPAAERPAVEQHLKNLQKSAN
jgi:tetratricopeptide (TPR) repeat protein